MFKQIQLKLCTISKSKVSSFNQVSFTTMKVLQVPSNNMTLVQCCRYYQSEKRYCKNSQGFHPILKIILGTTEYAFFPWTIHHVSLSLNQGNKVIGKMEWKRGSWNIARKSSWKAQKQWRSKDWRQIHDGFRSLQDKEAMHENLHTVM